MKSKRFLMLILLTLLSLVLAACSGENETKEDSSQQESVEQLENEQSESEDENGFDKVGDKKVIDGVTYELLKYKKVDQTIDIAPIKVTIQGIVLVKMTDIDENFGNFLSQYTNDSRTPTGANYLQIDYVYENTDESDIRFNGISTVVLNNGEQLDAIHNDFIWENNDSNDFYGKVQQKGSIGLIVEGNPDEINTVKIITSNSADSENEDIITESQRIELSFE